VCEGNDEVCVNDELWDGKGTDEIGFP